MKYIMLLLMCSCGNSISIPETVNVKPTKPIEVKPVKVDIPDSTQTVAHRLDITASAEMFRAQCEELFIEQEDVDTCMNEKLTEFLLTFQNILNTPPEDDV